MDGSKNQWLEPAARIAVVAFLIIGCFLVLMPFLSALMWAGIVCFTTWPLYARLDRLFRGRHTLSALAMILLISSVLAVPFVSVALTLADNRDQITQMATTAVNGGIPNPPEWLAKVPKVGPEADRVWRDWAQNPEKLGMISKGVVVSMGKWVLAALRSMAAGAAQLFLSVLVMFFIYRNGATVARFTRGGVLRLAGERADYFLATVGGTVRGVVYGLIGTALAQGILAGVGFWMAGVPSALFLGLLTFFVGLLPFGPPLVWAPAAWWLFHNGHPGWGVFMLVWGLCVVSGVDNVLRPYLISKGNNMPFVLVFLGVLGGLAAFGFIGLFLGPALLAIGYGLMDVWIGGRKEEAPAAPPPPA